MADRWWKALARWAASQSRRSWWVLPLQPVFTLTVLAAGISAIWPGMEFQTFHNRLGWAAAHGWMVLGIVCPLMTLFSYWLILRRAGKRRYRGFWLRLGGDLGQGVVLAVFALMHLSDTGSSEDVYVTVGFGGLLLALGMMVTRDVWEIVLTERLAGRIHRGTDRGNGGRGR